MNMNKQWNQGSNRAAAAWMALALALAGSVSAWAQATPKPPERLTYQGYLAGSDGVALGNAAPKPYDVIFRIYDSEAATTPLWGEQQTVTVDKGNFSVLLGEGATIAGVPNNVSLSSLFTGATASDRYIETTIKGIGSGGADVDIHPRIRLTSAPYVLVANRANSAVKLVQSSGAGADLLTSTSNRVTVAGEVVAPRLTASELVATTGNVVSNLNAGTLRSGSLVVSNVTDLMGAPGGILAGALACTSASGMSAPTLRANNLFATNSLGGGTINVGTNLTVNNRPAIMTESSGTRVLIGNAEYPTGNLTDRGYTITHPAAGVWDIAFNTPFTSPPAVVATVHGYTYATIGLRPYGTLSSGFGAPTAGASTTGVQIIITQPINGGTMELGMSFMIVGK